MSPFINHILNRLAGFTFWYVLILILLGVAGWHYLKRKDIPDALRLKWQMGLAVCTGILALTGILIQYISQFETFRFEEKDYGILVAQITGDTDAKMQHDLVSSLHNQLPDDSIRFVVRSSREKISEMQGIEAAHEKARLLGKKHNASLVMWGTKVSDDKFHPRITIIRDTLRILHNRTMSALDIKQLHLPDQLIQAPMLLSYFTHGYASYELKDYKAAIPWFSKALLLPDVDPNASSDISFYSANCHLFLYFVNQTDTTLLHAAVKLYKQAELGYQHQQADYNLAICRNNLGICERQLSLYLSHSHLSAAITSYEQALAVLDSSAYPYQWAFILNNAGVAWSEHGASDLKKAVAAFTHALSVFQQKQYRLDWAMAQNNLGMAYADMASLGRAELHETALHHLGLAGTVYTKQDHPSMWAMLQMNIGTVYTEWTTGERHIHLKTAIAHFDSALQVYSQADDPMAWAQTQFNLGLAYFGADQLDSALLAFRHAEEVWTPAARPSWNDNIQYYILRTADIKQQTNRMLE